MTHSSDPLMKRLRLNIRRYGVDETIRMVPKHLLERTGRRLLNPSLEAIHQAVTGVDLEPLAFVQHMLGVDPPFKFGPLLAEYAELREGVRMAAADPNLSYPGHFRMEGASLLATYALVRLRKPDVVVETGVANGESTYFLLSALERNGHGRLISIDVASDVGSIVPREDRGRWTLIVLSRPFSRSFRREFAHLAPFDIFIHDSCHDYRWQSLEYSLALDRLRHDGMLLSDDVDWSYAFIDAVKQAGRDAFALIDGRKVFGGIRPEGPYNCESSTIPIEMRPDP